MPLPKTDRVKYTVNPLDRVICQLRYPTILKISSEEPADFQESIRKQYPVFERSSGMQIELPAELPQEFANLLTPSMGPQAYRFTEKDGRRQFVLSQDFISYTDHDYKSWEEYSDHLFTAIDSISGIYGIEEFMRVGLRYVNRISRSDLSISKEPWAKLINPIILGPMGDGDFGNDVTASGGQFEARVDEVEGATVKVKYGLLAPDDSSQTDSVFEIDIDFGVVGEIAHEHVQKILNKFNEMDRGLFQWSIKPRLHEAMGPGRSD